MKENFYRVDKQNLLEVYLFHYKYTENKRSEYIWNWEYGINNPQNSLLLAVKDENDNIIATQGMMTIKIAFGNAIYETGKNESLLIDDAFRGKSLSSRLYKYAINEYDKENISFLWGFSRKAIIPLKKADFKIFEGVIKRLVLPVNFKQAQSIIPTNNLNGLKKHILKFIVLFATIYSKIIFNIKNLQKNKIPKTVEITQDLKKSSDIIKLYDVIKKDFPELIHIYQDEDYYNWRIKKSPISIDTFFLYENDELKGYFYLGKHEKFCEITDFTFVDEKYGKLLLIKLQEIIIINKYGFIFYTGNNTNLINKKVFKLLFSIGFIKIDGPNNFVLRNFNFQVETKLFKIENWYISDLWSEGI